MMLYELKRDFQAPDLESGKNGGALRFKPFKKGQRVQAKEYAPDESGRLTHVKSIIVEDKFIIPHSIVNEIDLPIGANGEESADIIIKDASKYMKNGIVAGFVLGTGIAVYTRKNWVMWMLGGAISGGVVGHVIGKAKGNVSKIQIVK